jgi:hypothetical protein
MFLLDTKIKIYTEDYNINFRNRTFKTFFNAINFAIMILVFKKNDIISSRTIIFGGEENGRIQI